MAAARILELDGPGYPAALRSLPQPPLVLYVRGRVELLSWPGIAVIGTRAHSIYGRDATVSFVVGLVRAGYVIVSGLARGIDGIAHRTALEIGGDTVAVLGTGIDVPYPPEHDELFQAIATGGCLVSEFPPGTPPLKYHFPRRNRIIAGLARGVLVVEAPEKSGAMNTAQHALELGKEVFAVPGPIHNPTSAGTSRLIQEGAALVTSAADILRILESRTGESLPGPLAQGLDIDELEARLRRQPEPGSSELARRVWDALKSGACGVDELSEDLGTTSATLSAALLELELAGLVERLPGPRYARALSSGGNRAR
ncbi:MAG TPA: DNA-processing protein DprA [Gemmatimonadota bacterium]|nr:DNA-processing protein DprA [Gemmatimonadota bacterium]